MGTVRIHLPRSLRAYWTGPAEAEVEADRLDRALAALGDLASRVVDEQGRIRQHVHVFVNARAIGHAPPQTIALSPGDVIHVLPAVSGGLA